MFRFNRIVRFIKTFLDKRTIKFAIQGINNCISNHGYIKNVLIDIQGNNNEIIIEKYSCLKETKIIIQGSNHKLIIGEHCTFSGELWFEDEYCEIQIGDNTTIEQAHVAVTERYSKIIIGNDCMLSNEIQIRTGDSHSIIDNISGKRINTAKDVVLKNHVWVGSRAIILKGVTIGDNSIIGTSTVVTKDVQANTIVAGNPAKQIKSDVNWLRQRI